MAGKVGCSKKLYTDSGKLDTEPHSAGAGLTSIHQKITPFFQKNTALEDEVLAYTLGKSC